MSVLLWRVEAARTAKAPRQKRSRWLSQGTAWE